MATITIPEALPAAPKLVAERIVLLPKDLAEWLADYAAAYGDKSNAAAIDILAEFRDRLTEPYDGEVLP